MSAMQQSQEAADAGVSAAKQVLACIGHDLIVCACCAGACNTECVMIQSTCQYSLQADGRLMLHARCMAMATGAQHCFRCSPNAILKLLAQGQSGSDRAMSQSVKEAEAMKAKKEEQSREMEASLKDCENEKQMYQARLRDLRSYGGA